LRARINLVTSDVAVIDDFLTQPDFRALRGYLNSTAFVQGLKGETIWKDDGHDPLGVRPRNNQGQGTGADAARGSSGFVRA